MASFELAGLPRHLVTGANCTECTKYSLYGPPANLNAARDETVIRLLPPPILTVDGRLIGHG